MSLSADNDAARRAGAVLTVDLANIAANWRGLRDAGRADGKPIDCAAVLKADAYGTGAAIVAPRLAAEGCRHFFVAHLEEGIALRAVVPEHPDAADEPVEFCERLSRAIAAEVHALRAIPAGERLATRLQRYRRIGLP